MAHAHSEITMLTPQGHEVRAEIDYDDFALRHAKVVNHYTGVIRPLDKATAETLERALKAKKVYEHAIAETKAVEQTLEGFGKLAAALGNDHPAIEPYWREAGQHKNIARDMYLQAQSFHEVAMAAIDKLADK